MDLYQVKCSINDETLQEDIKKLEGLNAALQVDVQQANAEVVRVSNALHALEKSIKEREEREEAESKALFENHGFVNLADSHNNSASTISQLRMLYAEMVKDRLDPSGGEEGGDNVRPRKEEKESLIEGKPVAEFISHIDEDTAALLLESLLKSKGIDKSKTLVDLSTVTNALMGGADIDEIGVIINCMSREMKNLGFPPHKLLEILLFTHSHYKLIASPLAENLWKEDKIATGKLLGILNDDGLTVNTDVNSKYLPDFDNDSLGDNVDLQIVRRLNSDWKDVTRSSRHLSEYGVLVADVGTQTSTMAGKKRNKRSLLKSEFPFSSHLANKSVKNRQFSMRSLQNLIPCIYSQKIQSDIFCADSGLQRKSLADTVNDYFLRKYGVATLAEDYTVNFARILFKYKSSTSPRLRVFSSLCGIINCDWYTPLQAELILSILVLLFPNGSLRSKMTSSAFEGVSYVPVDAALTAVKSVIYDPIAMGYSSPASHVGHQTFPISSANLNHVIYDIENSGVLPDSIADHFPRNLNSVTLYIDVDVVCNIVLSYFIDDMKARREVLMNIYHAFDEDKNGTLNFHEFEVLMVKILRQNYNTHEHFSLVDLFDMMNEKDDDEDDSSISVESFAAVCITKGQTHDDTELHTSPSFYTTIHYPLSTSARCVRPLHNKRH